MKYEIEMVVYESLNDDEIIICALKDEAKMIEDFFSDSDRQLSLYDRSISNGPLSVISKVTAIVT